MISESLRSLIDYHEWATQRMLGACMEVSEGDYRRDLGLQQRSIHQTLNYQLSTERNLMASYLKEDAPANVDIIGRDSLAAAMRQQCRRWRQLVASLSEERLDDTLDVIANNGIRSSLTHAELFYEVVNFGVLQRGMLTYAITWLGIPDPETDFIDFRNSP